MFPRVRPLTPWEASALLSNTGIAADLPNTAKLDRLTYLESVVANLLLGQPKTLGLAALPAVKSVEIEESAHDDLVVEVGAFTGAHFVVVSYINDTDDEELAPCLRTRTAVEMIAEMPHVVPGDAWLVLVQNCDRRALALVLGHGVLGEAVDIPPSGAQLLLVAVESLTAVRFTPILAGRLHAAVVRP